MAISGEIYGERLVNRVELSICLDSEYVGALQE